jgi:hypothetical protein
MLGGGGGEWGCGCNCVYTAIAVSGEVLAQAGDEEAWYASVHTFTV